METVNIFCRELTKETFDQIPSDIQKLFYIWAIFCNTKHVGKQDVTKHVLQSYRYLILQAGITGRKELCGVTRINPAQRILPKVKGNLKAIRIQSLINHYNVDPNTVYFYDDGKEVVSVVRKETGINAILVDDSKNLHPEYLLSLIEKKKYNPKSVTMVLLDFDKTITRSNFRKRWLTKSNQNIITHHLGGFQRMNTLFHFLRALEHEGVLIGIITCQTSELVRTVLTRIGWLA